ncbi:MAG: hypothetical protein CMB06_01115, partial [Euryarchaeota archaeon]|nr:hypothetical protein [Euryarchaeota archaeon]
MNQDLAAKVHEGFLAGPLLGSVAGGLLGLGRPNLPEPRVIVYDPNGVLVKEDLARAVSGVRIVPLLKVDEYALMVLFAVLSLALHHVNAVNLAEADLFDGLLHALLGDVWVHPRDAKRWLIS